MVIAVVCAAGMVTPHSLAQESTKTSRWASHRGNPLHRGLSDSTTEATKGKIKWKTRVGHRVNVSPLIADGVVYVADAGGIVYALNGKTGERQWSSKARVGKRAASDALAARNANENLAPMLETAEVVPQPYSFSNPCLDDNNIYAATETGLVTAFSRRDGSVVWEKDFATDIYCSLQVQDGKLLFGANDNILRCLDAATGDLVWKFSAADWIGATPIITRKGTVIAPTHDKFIYKLDLQDGELLEKFDFGYRTTSTAAMAFGSMYFCSTGRRFNCIDVRSGETRWHHSSTAQHLQGVGVWKQQVMVVISKFLLCYDAIGGKEKWRTILKGPSLSSPCIGKSLGYITDKNGTLYAFDLATGDIKWEGILGKPSLSCPVLADGLVYVAEGTGLVMAWE